MPSNFVLYLTNKRSLARTHTHMHACARALVRAHTQCHERYVSAAARACTRTVPWPYEAPRLPHVRRLLSYQMSSFISDVFFMSWRQSSIETLCPGSLYRNKERFFLPRSGNADTVKSTSTMLQLKRKTSSGK